MPPSHWAKLWMNRQREHNANADSSSEGKEESIESKKSTKMTKKKSKPSKLKRSKNPLDSFQPSPEPERWEVDQVMNDFDHYIEKNANVGTSDLDEDSIVLMREFN